MSATWKELMDMQSYLSSIDFLEPLDEVAGFDLDLWFAKWNIVGTDIIVCMKKSCKLMVYRKSSIHNHKKTGVRMPKYISLEELLSDQSLDKKSRARLAWLIGETE